MSTCPTASSSSSSYESAVNATVQFISLGYSRQSMNFRPIPSSSAVGLFLGIPRISAGFCLMPQIRLPDKAGAGDEQTGIRGSRGRGVGPFGEPDHQYRTIN